MPVPGSVAEKAGQTVLPSHHFEPPPYRHLVRFLYHLFLRPRVFWKQPSLWNAPWISHFSSMCFQKIWPGLELELELVLVTKVTACRIVLLKLTNFPLDRLVAS